MKILNTINGSIKKFAKGMFALFMINILIFGGTLLVQSCQTDDEVMERTEQKLALSKFENLIRETTPKIENIIEKQQKHLKSKNGITSKAYKQNEEQMKESLKPLVEGTKELLVAYNISDEELKEDFENLDDSRIAIIGLIILAAESEEKNQTAMNFANIFMPSAHAATMKVNPIVECAVEAIGLDVIYSIASEGLEKAGKKGLKKAFKKIASKFLGPVGVGITVAEFAWCMYTHS